MVSPTLIFNEGRQRLNGNVGYRVIEANIRELRHNPPGENLGVRDLALMERCDRYPKDWII